MCGGVNGPCDCKGFLWGGERYRDPSNYNEEPLPKENSMYSFEVYEAKDGWRWRLVAENSRIVADSGEAYVSKGNALRAVSAIESALGLNSVDRTQFIIFRREHFDEALHRAEVSDTAKSILGQLGEAQI